MIFCQLLIVIHCYWEILLMREGSKKAYFVENKLETSARPIAKTKSSEAKYYLVGCKMFILYLWNKRMSQKRLSPWIVPRFFSGGRGLRAIPGIHYNGGIEHFVN